MLVATVRKGAGLETVQKGFQSQSCPCLIPVLSTGRAIMPIDGAGRVLEKVMGNDEPQQVAGCRMQSQYQTAETAGDLCHALQRRRPNMKEREDRNKSTRDFYIAYFRILGCRCFLKQNPEKANDLLSDMHKAFATVSAIVDCVQRATFDTMNGNPERRPKLNAYKKAFSDQVLMCFEKTGDAFFDFNNLLAMASIVADIQREFILKYGITLRGCITEGAFAIDDDLAFGPDLVDATSMDDYLRMPRIVFTPMIIEELSRIRTSTSCHELGWFYDRWMDELLFGDDDGNTVLNYLYSIDLETLERTPFFAQVSSALEGKTSETCQCQCHDHNGILGIECVMKEHANIISDKLGKYGVYGGVDDTSDDTVRRRRDVHRKYQWVAKFHNAVCERNGLGGECRIDSIAEPMVEPMAGPEDEAAARDSAKGSRRYCDPAYGDVGSRTGATMRA